MLPLTVHLKEKCPPPLALSEVFIPAEEKFGRLHEEVEAGLGGRALVPESRKNEKMPTGKLL